MPKFIRNIALKYVVKQMSKCDKVIAVSNYMKNQIISLGVKSDIVVIKNGTNFKETELFDKNYIRNNYNIDDRWIENYEQKAEYSAKQSSEREKIATKVERESEDLKKAEYMEGKIGQEYEGIISSVTQFGVFVELPNTVEGLIRFENLGDEYFIYDEDRKILIGEKTKQTYSIGDKIKIRVISASKALRQIDFEKC